MGADLDARDRAGRTPAHVAAFASHDDAVTALAMELGNKPDLITSVYNGTALIAAAHLGHHDVVARLVEGGAPLDHVHNLVWTALIEVVVLGDGGPDHIKTVQILVEAGADKTILDRDGVTPLQHAMSRGYTEMVALLQ